MVSLWVIISLITYTKRKLKAFKISYDFNGQYHGAKIFFVILKMLHPDTHSGCSETNTNQETMKLSNFKHDYTKANLHILEWKNEISIPGYTYS